RCSFQQVQQMNLYTLYIHACDRAGCFHHHFIIFTGKTVDDMTAHIDIMSPQFPETFRIALEIVCPVYESGSFLVHGLEAEFHPYICTMTQFRQIFHNIFRKTVGTGTDGKPDDTLYLKGSFKPFLENCERGMRISK